MSKGAKAQELEAIPRDSTTLDDVLQQFRDDV